MISLSYILSYHSHTCKLVVDLLNDLVPYHERSIKTKPYMTYHVERKCVENKMHWEYEFTTFGVDGICRHQKIVTQNNNAQ